MLPCEHYFLKKISHTRNSFERTTFVAASTSLTLFRNLRELPTRLTTFDRLFPIHDGIGFEGNLARLVEATNNISPTGIKFAVSEAAAAVILAAPDRAARFIGSEDCSVLKAELDAQVNKFRSEILLAALIENVNVRGRVIEYLIAGEDEALRQKLVAALKAGNKGIPKFKTDNTLGDYPRFPGL